MRELQAALAAAVAGEVRFDAGARAAYASEASNYRQVPIGVVLPRSADDVLRALAVCRAEAAPVLARGGGTSMCGQSVNVAVLFDFSKYMDRVLAVDAQARSALVEPGVVCDSLHNLPVGILPPRIQTAVFDERALRLGLTGSSKAELYQEALEIRKTLFDRGVPRIDIDGWSEPQLEITVSGDRLQALGMSLAQIADQLRAQLTVNIAGNLRRNGDDLVISSRGSRLDENALANLQLANGTGATFRLGEIAQVGWGEGAQQIARVNGRDGIIITLFRSLDTDTLEISAIKVALLSMLLESGQLMPLETSMKELKNVLKSSLKTLVNMSRTLLAIFATRPMKSFIKLANMSLINTTRLAVKLKTLPLIWATMSKITLEISVTRQTTLSTKLESTSSINTTKSAVKPLMQLQI